MSVNLGIEIRFNEDSVGCHSVPLYLYLCYPQDENSLCQILSFGNYLCWLLFFSLILLFMCYNVTFVPTRPGPFLLLDLKIYTTRDDLTIDYQEGH